jgi:Family of unknown function (DUF6221)
VTSNNEQIAAIRAQLAEDERVAKAATQGNWKLWAMAVLADQDGTSNVDTAVLVANTFSMEHDKPLTFNATHIARWDPMRVLARVEATQAILDRYERLRHAKPATDADAVRWGLLMNEYDLRILPALAEPAAKHHARLAAGTEQ